MKSLIHVSKIPYQATLMIQAGPKLWFIHARHVLSLFALLAVAALSSCASLQQSDGSYTIDRYGNTSNGRQFTPSEGNISSDSSGTLYIRTNPGTAYQRITTSEGKECKTQNPGTAYERVLCQ